MIEGQPAAVILVVDDDVQIRRLMRHFLTSAGYEVHEAASATSAAAFLREREVDLAIVDLFMPEQDGFQMIQFLRGTGQKLKIVAMSGHAEPFLRIAVQVGADALISKPFTEEELSNKVRDLLVSSDHLTEPRP